MSDISVTNLEISYKDISKIEKLWEACFFNILL